MKKFLKSSVVSLSIICLFLATNCKKKADILPGVGLGCATNAEKLSTALNAYLTNPTKANCEKYKDELRAFFKGCPSFYTGVTKKELEDALAEPCD